MKERIRLLESDSSSSNQQLLDRLRKAEESERDTMDKLKALRKQHSTLDGDHSKLKREHEYVTERLEILTKQLESDAEEMARMRQ